MLTSMRKRSRIRNVIAPGHKKQVGWVKERNPTSEYQCSKFPALSAVASTPMNGTLIGRAVCGNPGKRVRVRDAPTGQLFSPFWSSDD